MADVTDHARYLKAVHAVQTGVAMLMHYNPKLTDLKHLRVGVASSLCAEAALATLLIEKGIITKEEHVKAQADAMEAEVAVYERELKECLGTKVTLG
jgi:hypothetical protein